MKTKKLMIYFVLTGLCLSMFISNVVSPEVNENREHGCAEIFVCDYQNDSLKNEKNVNKYALLISIEDYPPGVKDLDYTVDDAYDMCDVLINNCYFDPENIRVLTDSNATKTNIESNITWLASNAKQNDTILFFFSGHGGYNYVLAYGDTISDDELDLWVSDINSTNVAVIIDSCYAGSMIEKSKTDYSDEVKNFSYMQGVKNTSPKKVNSLKGLGKSGRIVLAACAENQYSWEYDELSNGVFTYYLVEGFKSALADTNGNGWVSVEEAFYYAQPRTYEFNDSDNPAGGQDPQIYDGIEGELDISSLTLTGDLIVDDTKTYSNIPLPLNKNLIITGTGNLTLNNVILMMNCSFDGEYHIEVQSGGQLYIYNSNITSANEYHYLFWVRNDSRFEMRDSELSKCGWNWDNRGLTIETPCLIENCRISSNFFGICLYSHNNTITNSAVTNNTMWGIYLHNSSHNFIEKCKILNNAYGILLYNSLENTIVNCNISYNMWANTTWGIRLEYSANNLVKNCEISNNGYALGIEFRYSNNNMLVNITCYNNVWGIYFSYFSNNNTVSNSICYNNDESLSTYDSDNNSIINSSVYENIFLSSSHLYLLNTTFNKTKVSMINSSLTVSWYLNVNVIWKNNISTEYANVIIFDNLTNEVFNCSTDEDGIIKNIIVDEYIKNQTTTTYFTPYSITASKNGYYGFTTGEMNQNMEILVYLEDITPPNANAGEDKEIDKNTTVYFDGSNSTDNSGVIGNYTWGFVDSDAEVKLYGVSPNYTFYNAGVFTMTLNVTDENGNWDADTINIKVKDRTPPNANAGEDQVVSHGITMHFDGSNSTDNVGIVNYTWIFFDNDGIVLYGVNPEYVFLALGTHIVTLTVKDEAGNIDTDTVNIIVKDATKPTIKIVSPEPVVHSRDYIVKCIVVDNVKVERVEVSLNNQSWSSCVRENTDEYTATLILENGGNTVYIRATDSSGNVNTTSITVFVEAPENVFPVFTSDTIMLLIGIIFCITLTIILERKPKRRKGL